MSEQESSESKRRGVGFPSLSLQDAIDAVVVAGLNGPDHSHDAFAAYLGHQTANSGAFRAKLASLRDWGLIARGDRDRVILSALAQDLVLAVPHHYAEKQLLFTAFESCRIFGMVYGDSAKNMPLEFSRIRTQILMRNGVASSQADKFVDSFVKSAVFVGIAQTDGSTVTLLPRESVFTDGATGAGDPVGDDQADANFSAAEPVASAPGLAPRSVAAAALVASPQTPVALRQQWPISGGEIEFVIRTSEALPPSIYMLVAEMAGVAEKMKDKLTGPAVEITTTTPRAAYLNHDSEG